MSDSTSNTNISKVPSVLDGDSPTRTKLETEFVCEYLQLSDENRALVKRMLLALANDDVSELEALKADSPAASNPILDSCISDIEGVK